MRSNKIKIGFLHIPRTGGTYIESVLSTMGPSHFVNFFGTPENQISNKITLIENIDKDPNIHKTILKNSNWKTCKLFSGHFSYNLNKYFTNENIKYITVLRDPIQRTTSFIKKITTSKIFCNILTNGSNNIDNDIFWNNFIDYVETNDTRGLMPHEIHGFSNYMTKAIAGLDLSNKNVKVNEEIFHEAIKNLDHMVYVGLFENYSQTIKNILALFDIKSNFNDRGLKISLLPDHVISFMIQLNKYDIRLYNYFREKNE
jgi:hypothetical protein